MKKRISPAIFYPLRKETQKTCGTGVYLQKKPSHMFAGLPPCPFYAQNGFCENKHKMSHLDCQQFTKFQYCQKQMNNTCVYYHRKECRQWKLEGVCEQANCGGLHRDCEQFKEYQFCAREQNCPFYHRAKNANKAQENAQTNNGQMQKTMKSPFIIRTKKNNENGRVQNQNVMGLAVMNRNKKLLQKNLESIEKRQQIIEVRKPPEQEEESKSDSEMEEQKSLKKEQVIPAVQMQKDNRRAEQSLASIPVQQEKEEEKLSPATEKSMSQNSELNDLNDYAHYAAHLFDQDEQRRIQAEQSMRQREEQEEHEHIQQLQFRSQRQQQLQQQQQSQERRQLAQQISDESKEEESEEVQEEEEKLNEGLPSGQLRLGLLEEITSRQDYLVLQLNRFQQIQQQARLISSIVGPGNPEAIRLLRSLDSLVQTFQTLSRLAQVSQNGTLGQIVLAASNLQLIDKSEWGLSQKEFEQLPINIFGVTNDSADGFNAEKDNSTKTACPICLDEYKVGDILRGLYCSHQFHEICLKEWAKKKRECPLCKMKITIK